MCDPATFASMALSAVSSLAQIQAQNAQAEYQNKLREANIRRAKKTQATEQHLVNKRLMEEEAAAVDKSLQLSVEEMKAKGITQASARNTGLSLENLMYDYERQKAMYSGNITKNLKNAYAQASAEKEGISADAAGMIDSVAPAAKASPLAAVISTLGTALDAYQIHVHRTPGDVGTAKTGSAPKTRIPEYGGYSF